MDIYSIVKLIIALFGQVRQFFGLEPPLRTNISAVPFAIVWNVPSAVCQDEFKVFLNLSKYGIIQNENQSFFGKNIVLFYEPTPGLYPKYLSNGSAINGGLPQNSNLPQHLQRVVYDVDRTIPTAEFSGLAVVDWESWRPIFDRNSYDKDKEVYLNKSEELVKRNHPTWNDSQVETQARLDFETSARLLMNQTLWKARQIRKDGKWGFYGFPRCYNYGQGQAHCANDTIQYNDELSWLFNASSALFPSIYLDKDLFPSVEDRALRVQGILRESLRVRDNLRELQQCEDCQQDKTKPIYAYTMYRYRQEQFYITPDLENTIGQSFDAGLDGVVVWDSSANFRNMTDCLSMRDYLDHTLGPYINSVNSFADQCYTQWCSGHGRCLRIAWPPTKSEEATDNQKHTDQPNRREFSMYRCDCSVPWTGEHCEDQL